MHQHRDRLVIEDDAIAQQAVVAMAGEGIERDVAEDADLRHFLLDRADGTADKIVRIERFASRLIAQARIGVGKQRNAGDCQLGRPFGFPDNAVDRQALARRAWMERGVSLPSLMNKGQIRIVGRKHALTHHASRPFGPPVAAHAYRQIERA